MLALQERGYRFAIITNQSAPEHAPLDHFHDIPVYRFPFGQALAHHDVGKVLGICRQIDQIRQAFAPDLIYIYFTTIDAFFYLHTLAGRSVPLILTMHNPPHEALLQPGTIYGRLLRLADWVTTPSLAVRDAVMGQAPEVAARLSSLLHALPQPDLAAAPLPFDPPHFLCLGRLVPDKGFATAIAAFALVLARFPHVRLAIAGDGPLRESLKEQVRALSLGESVHVIGPVREVQTLLNQATVVVVSSRHNEGFGLVALEAAQMARPVIATRIGGLPEVVLDERTGLLVKPDNPLELAQAMGRLLEDSNLAHSLGQAAYSRARFEFRWDRYVAAYDALCHQLVSC